MRNIIKRVVFVAPVLLVAILTTTQVGAHPGHHMESSVSAIMQHLLSSPYHIGLAIGVALSLSLAAGLAVWKVRTKKHSNANRNISIN